MSGSPSWPTPWALKALKQRPKASSPSPSSRRCRRCGGSPPNAGSIRGHALVAFGGAAGQMACWVAEALGATEVLSPRFASLLSAWGIGQAQIRDLRQAGLERPLDAEGLKAAEALAGRLSEDGRAALAAQAAEAGAPQRRLMLRYDGADDAVLAVDFAEPAAARAAFEAAQQASVRLHRTGSSDLDRQRRGGDRVAPAQTAVPMIHLRPAAVHLNPSRKERTKAFRDRQRLPL